MTDVQAIIVDDEELISEGLSKRVPWNALQIEMVATAVNGIDALAKIKQFRPEILITDIRMPQMDGLELTRKVREFIPEMKIIILTGFNDFGYAQQAISLGVEDYVLKPVDIDTLSECIERSGSAIREERKRSIERTQLRKHIKESFPFLKNWFFNILDSPGIADEAVIARLRALHIPLAVGCYVAVAVTIDDTPLHEESVQLELYRTCMSMKTILDRRYPGSLVFFDGKEYTVILSLAAAEQPELIRLSYGAATKIHEFLEYKLHLSYTVGIGRPEIHLRDIPRSLRAAREACKYRFYLGAHSIVHINDVEPNSRENPLPAEKFDALSVAVRIGDVSQAEDVLRTIFASFSSIKADIAVVRKTCLEILIYTLKAASELNSRTGTLLQDLDPWQSILIADTIEALEQVIRSFVVYCAGIANAGNKSRNQGIVSRVRDIVNRRYAETNLLEVVADEIYLSPCYVSFIFRQETGMTFKEYVIQTRIETAKRLLRDFSIRIYEVAEHSGYSDSHYFSQLFKKQTGMTPSQYRDSIET